MRAKRTSRATLVVRVAFVTFGLAGAVYAGEQVTAPPPADDLTQTITDQRIREGSPAKPPEDPEHQLEKLTPEQMQQLVNTYATESKAAYEHGETVRIQAYRSRDIIRMTCIDDKLTQMKEVLNLAAARALTFPTLTSDDLRLRQHFLVLMLARRRVQELATEIEGCMGDVLDAVTFGRVKEETAPNDTTYDPTRPPTPGHDIERPGEASPYR
jgi:hypothetical protein